MSIEYRMEDGQYACYLDGERIIKCDEVGVLLDQRTGSQLQHGNPAAVEARFHEMRKAFEDSGYTQEANDLAFFKGRFKLEDLNRFVGTSGYTGRFYRKHVASAAAAGIASF